VTERSAGNHAREHRSTGAARYDLMYGKSMKYCLRSKYYFCTCCSNKCRCGDLNIGTYVYECFRLKFLNAIYNTFFYKKKIFFIRFILLAETHILSQANIKRLYLKSTAYISK
jgi:hypothetical protein